MAHYAFLNNDNIIVQIITGKDENEGGINWEEFYENEIGLRCKRTSYNTSAGKHLLGGTPFRKNYAMIGGVYDEERDAFYIQKPFPSWILNEESCIWEPPVLRPNDIYDYRWNEEDQVWDRIN